MQPAAPTPQTTPLPRALLWERLRALFARIIAAIGAPALLATLTLAPLMRKGITRQLALVEILARKLLLAEAAALPQPAPQRGPRVVEVQLAASGLYTAPRARRRARAASTARAIDLNNPAAWHARFALAIPRDRRVVRDRDAPRARAFWDRAPTPMIEPAPRNHCTTAFTIARRAEALRRMLENPTPYVMRLARTRRIGVARSRETIQRYALRAPRRFVGDRRDPKLTLDIFMQAIRANEILGDTR